MPLAQTDIQNFIAPILRNDFWEAYQDAQFAEEAAIINAIADVHDVAGDTAKFPFLGASNPMERLLGDRRHTAPNTYNYTLQFGKEWETGEDIEVAALQDDMTGQLRQMVRGYAREVFANRLYRLTLAVLDGGATLCYDGQYFFDTDHPYKTLAGAAATNGTNTSGTDLSADGLETAWSAMASFLSDQGRPLRVRPTHLMVGPKLAKRAMTLLESPIVVAKATGTSGYVADYKNVWQNYLTLIVNPYIQGTNSAGTTIDYYWFLLDCSKAAKPFQCIKKPGDTGTTFTELWEDSEYAQLTRRIFLGATDRFEAGYGLWQLAYRGAGTA